MDRIKAELSKEFLRIFTRELQDKGGYTVVDTGAEDVLILRPAIINLDVSAPDKMTPGMSETFTASALSMTLYLELYDSVTSQILARYIHADGDREGTVMVANRVTNKAAADRVMTRWADRLRKGLDDAHKETGSKPPAEK
jgi:soluble P-type ATPase